MADDTLMVATRSYFTEIDGQLTRVTAGQTRAHAGHKVVTQAPPGSWEPVGASARFSVETTTDSPGETQPVVIEKPPPVSVTKPPETPEGGKPNG